MQKIARQRMTAKIEGEFCLFLIGMRVNRWWKVHQWLPVALAMPAMVKELKADPGLGFLHAEAWFGNPTIMVQYWTSFEAIELYARNPANKHLPAWESFNRRVAKSGDVGVWHETYRIAPGSYESIYNNMPAFGLAKAGAAVPLTARMETARNRFSE